MDNSRLPVDKPGALGQVGRYKGTRGHHRRPEPVDKPVDKYAGASVRVSCILSVLPSVRTRSILSVLSVRLLLPKITQITSYFHVTP